MPILADINAAITAYTTTEAYGTRRPHAIWLNSVLYKEFLTAITGHVLPFSVRNFHVYNGVEVRPYDNSAINSLMDIVYLLRDTIFSNSQRGPLASFPIKIVNTQSFECFGNIYSITHGQSNGTYSLNVGESAQLVLV